MRATERGLLRHLRRLREREARIDRFRASLALDCMPMNDERHVALSRLGLQSFELRFFRAVLDHSYICSLECFFPGKFQPDLVLGNFQAPYIVCFCHFLTPGL